MRDREGGREGEGERGGDGGDGDSDGERRAREGRQVGRETFETNSFHSFGLKILQHIRITIENFRFDYKAMLKLPSTTTTMFLKLYFRAQRTRLFISWQNFCNAFLIIIESISVFCSSVVFSLFTLVS